MDERIQLDDTQVLAVLEKMIKQRRESITQFEAGGRADLVAKESAELAVLQAYLPAQLAETEVESLIRAAIASTGAASMKDMGKVMAAVKPQVQGRTDMGALSARIKGCSAPDPLFAVPRRSTADVRLRRRSYRPPLECHMPSSDH